MRTQPFVPPPAPKVVNAVAPSRPQTEAPEPQRLSAAEPVQNEIAQTAPSASPSSKSTEEQVVELLNAHLSTAPVVPSPRPLNLAVDPFHVKRGENILPVPLLTALALGLMETRIGREWGLYSAQGQHLLTITAAKEAIGSPEYVELYKQFEMLMLLEHLNSANTALGGVLKQIQDNARKPDILRILESEQSTVQRLLQQRFVL